MNLLQETFSLALIPQSELGVSLLRSYIILCLSSQLPRYIENCLCLCQAPPRLPNLWILTFTRAGAGFHSSLGSKCLVKCLDAVGPKYMLNNK